MLISFDTSAKKAIMECSNPYPCHYDRGILTTIARKFMPPNATSIEVQLDRSKPSRQEGADSSFYVITWI
jgi:hypothetical protein